MLVAALAMPKSLSCWETLNERGAPRTVRHFRTPRAMSDTLVFGRDDGVSRGVTGR